MNHEERRRLQRTHLQTNKLAMTPEKEIIEQTITVTPKKEPLSTPKKEIRNATTPKKELKHKSVKFITPEKKLISRSSNTPERS